MQLAAFDAVLTPAVITADFEGMHAKLDSLLEPFAGLTAEQVATMEPREQKGARAGLNAMAKELDEARKAVKRAYNAPLAEFEGRVKELTARIAGPAALLDSAIKTRESADRQARFGHLADHYASFAPALCDVVPPERMVERQWANASFGEKKAERELEEKVSGIAREWETLKSAALAFPVEAEAEFFRTLSLNAALEFDQRRAEEQDRIEAMREQVEANRAEERKEPAPAPAPIAYAAPNPIGGAVFEQVKVFAVTIDATDTQMASLKAAMVGLGIHGKIHSLPGFTTWKQAADALFAR